MSVASMAWKNLARQKRRSFLLGGAIAFGILVITVVTGLSNSLITSLEANISNLVSGHIFIRGTEKTDKGRVLYTLPDAALFDQVIQDLKVPYKYLSKTTVAQQAALISDFSTTYQSVTGAELGPGTYLHDRMTIVEGSLDHFAGSDLILIGEGIAKKLQVGIGDRVSIQAETVYGQQNVLDFHVGAIYKDPGIAASLAGAFADLPRVNTLRDVPQGDFNIYGIYLQDVSTADSWGAKIYQALQDRGVNLWKRGSPQDLMRLFRDEQWTGVRYSLFTLNDALSFIRGIFQSLNLIALLILVVLFVVIMVGITNTYRMVVYERMREIGTLRALGMQRGSVRSLFLLEAIFLALVGIAVGWISGVAVLGILSLVDLSGWKDFNILLHDNHLRLALNGASTILHVAVVTAMTALAALAPARKAGRLTPAEALRTTN